VPAERTGQVLDPEIAAVVEATFGTRAALAVRYTELLATTGVEWGLLGPREADRVWSRHVFNSVAVAPLIPANAAVVDLGSGAGLPGIPLALARPDLRIVLLEPMARRVAFLQQCVDALALPRLEVRRGRAQDGLSRRVEVVVARAVAPLARLAELALPLATPSGVLLALKGAKAVAEAAELSAAGRHRVEVIETHDPLGASVTVVAVHQRRSGRAA
jgi:16S rRNA (guanine527-N7)-methyltransferase